MALTCTINSASALPKVNSVSLEFDAGQRSTLSLVIEDPTGAYDPVVGWPVTFSEGAALKFGGTIANVERGRLDESTSGLRYNITATGWENRLDKRFIGTSAPPYGVFVYAPIPFTAAVVSNVLTATAHPLVDGYAVQVWSTGSLPAPLAAATTYYVISAGTNTLKLSATSGGGEIDITDVGTGEHELKWMAGSVVKHTLANWCGSEEITAGTISNGVAIEKIICDWKRVSELLDDCATASNYLWYITPAKVLNFVPRTATAGTYSLTDAIKNFRALTIKTDRSQYWNRGMRRVAWAAFGKTEETLTCDGVVTSWLLDHNVAVLDKITLNGVDQTVGERWVYASGTKTLATGYNFYYDPGMRGIWQDTGDPLLQPADVLVVTYRELGTDVVDTFDAGEMGTRAGIEGGSGDYGHFTDDSQNVDAVGALALETALRVQHQAIPLEISWEADSLETNSGDLRPGVLITVAITGPPAITPPPAVPGTFLITSVTARDVDGLYLVYTVNATDKTIAAQTGLGLFEEFMGALDGGGILTLGGPTVSDESLGVPGILTLTPALYEYGVLSIENCSLAGSNLPLVQGMYVNVVYADELASDLWAELLSGIDDATDPVTLDVTINPDKVTELEFEEGDWVLFGDEGKYEIGQLSSITPSGGNTYFEVIRHYPGTDPGRATFESLMAAHSSGVKLYKLQVRAWTFANRGGTWDDADGNIPGRFDMAMPSVAVAAIVASSWNSAGFGPWTVYNCATATCPGVRTLQGGDYMFQRSGELAVLTRPAISKMVQYQSSLRVNYATLESAPTGASAIVKVQRLRDGAETWDDLATLTIAAGARISWAPDYPPGERRMPYDEIWPTAVLYPGDRLNYSITQTGTTAKGAGLTVEVFT